jgi:hypothetical protein
MIPPLLGQAEESIGRFPTVPAEQSPAPPAPRERTAQIETPLLETTPPIDSQLIEGAPPPQYGWPHETANETEFDIAPPTCACPDCGGPNCRGGRCIMEHFSGWNADGNYFEHDNPDDPARHVGKGEPLYGTSWLNRPHYTAVMLGGVLADGPLEPFAEHENSGLFSLYQGYDFDHFWGGEMRLAVGRFGLINDTQHNNDVVYIDAHLSYYPWGDARLRPYLSSGVGFMSNDFTDNRDLEFHELLLTFPLAVGLKYQMQPHYAIRFDLTQNISLGDGGLDTMDNISLSAGVEWHYGGPRKSYFPWNAGVYGH